VAPRLKPLVISVSAFGLARRASLICWTGFS
jgi:hypothetical protein